MKHYHDTQGKAVPKMPFTGELMRCAACRRQKRSNARVASNWTLFDTGQHRFYICPICYQRGKHRPILENLLRNT